MRDFNRPLNQTSRLTLVLRNLQKGDQARLRRALEAVPGVISVYVGSGTEAVYVIYDPARATPEDLRQAVQGENIQTEDRLPWVGNGPLYSKQ